MVKPYTKAHSKHSPLRGNNKDVTKIVNRTQMLHLLIIHDRTGSSGRNETKAIQIGDKKNVLF